VVEGTSVNEGALERTALKEWAVLVDAMARGDIVAMVRKGGIRERRAGFEVRHDRFLLYPTYFHENRTELAERLRGTLDDSHAHRPPPGVIRVAHLAEAIGVWNVTEAALLPAIAEFHGLAPGAVESRFHYRGVPGVRIVAMRVLTLSAAVVLPEARRYEGCVSWLELDADVDVSGAKAVLPSEELANRVARIRSLLGDPE
jgi:hypothetical protein